MKAKGGKKNFLDQAGWGNSKPHSVKEGGKRRMRAHLQHRAMVKGWKKGPLKKGTQISTWSEKTGNEKLSKFK